jgi:hypothetical protein
MKCEFCHRLQVGAASGDNAYAVLTYDDTTIVIDPTSGNNTVSKAVNSRTAIMTLGDYETGTYPATIKNNDTYSLTLSGGKWLAKIGGVATTASFSKGNTTGDATVLHPKIVLCGGELVNPSDPTLGFKNQTACGGGAKEYPLYDELTGYADKNASTQTTAFTPIFVTWTGTGTSLANASFNGSGSRIVNRGGKYHAASLVACLDCHGGTSPSYAGHESTMLSEECQLCHYGAEFATDALGSNKMTNLEAGGFGMGLTNGKTDTGSLEVHKNFVKAEDTISVYGGRYSPASNDACIACHTHVQVDITYNRPTTLAFTVNTNATADPAQNLEIDVGTIGATGNNATYSPVR